MLPHYDMNKKQLLKHLQADVYCRLMPSKIHGVGVFAIRDIPKGISPFAGSHIYKEVIFSKDELRNLHPEVKKIINDFLISEGTKVFIPSFGLNGIDISFFINHSNSPTIFVDKKGIFRAMKDIHKGEELTYDYNHEYGEENVSL